jgi:DNA repair protein RadC
MYRLPVYRLQMVKERTLPVETRGIRSPAEAAAVLSQFLMHADREHFVALLMNVPVRDHLVIGDAGRFVSIAEQRLL